jgi:hypothetical protein
MFVREFPGGRKLAGVKGPNPFGRRFQGGPGISVYGLQGIHGPIPGNLDSFPRKVDPVPFSGVFEQGFIPASAHLVQDPPDRDFHFFRVFLLAALGQPAQGGLKGLRAGMKDLHLRFPSTPFGVDLLLASRVSP